MRKVVGDRADPELIYKLLMNDEVLDALNATLTKGTSEERKSLGGLEQREAFEKLRLLIKQATDLPNILDQLLDHSEFKDKLRLVLEVKGAASFKDFFGQLGSTTEKDIALALIHQATVVSKI